MGGWETALLAVAGTIQGMQQSRQQEKYQRQVQGMQMQQAQSEIAGLEEQRASAERERRERLERAEASQRAAFASSGVSADGSGDAVFGNLLAQSEQERDDLNNQINRRIGSLQSGIQMNLLSRPNRSELLTDLTKVGIGLHRGAKSEGWIK